MPPKEDPLDSAKIGDGSDNKKKKSKAKDKDESSTPAVETSAEPVAPKPPPAKPLPLPDPPEGLPPCKSGRYKVLKTKSISWYGAMTSLEAGAEVSLRSYGTLGMKRLLEQGVEFEPIGD